MLSHRMPNAHTPCDFAVWSSIAFSRFQRSGATRGCNVAPTAQGDKPSGTETELPGSGDPWKTDRRQNLPAQGEKWMLCGRFLSTTIMNSILILESFIRCLRGKSTGFSPALTVPERLGSQVHGCPFKQMDPKALQQQLQRLPEVRIRQSSEFVGYALLLFDFWCLSPYVSMSVPLYLSICFYVSIYLSIYPSIHPSIHLLICRLSVHTDIQTDVCLYV